MPLSIDEQLLPHRNAIDSIDAEILRLLNERAGHAHAIGELKGTGAVYRGRFAPDSGFEPRPFAG